MIALAPTLLVLATPLTDLTVEYLRAPLGVDVPAPRFSFAVTSSNPRSLKSPLQYQLQVARDSTFDSLTWDSGNVASKPIRYNGPTLLSNTLYHGRVKVEGLPFAAASTFHTGLFLRDDWKGTWITGGDNKTLLRKDFNYSGSNGGRAVLFVAGIGYAEAFVNGLAVSDQKLSAGWSDFSKRVYYATFDVTDLLRPNAPNAIGVSLGNGWFSCGPSPGTTQPGCTHSPPQLVLQLSESGSSSPPLVASDLSWQAGASPITYNSLYNGEHFDAIAAAKSAGWAAPGFTSTAASTSAGAAAAASSSSSWPAVTAASSVADKALLASALFEPTRHVAVLPPLKVTSPAAGVQVFDFGQNLAGVVRLSGLRCAAGQKVTVRHAELLTHPPYGAHDGSIYVANLRKAQATDVYTCRGDPAGESYTPSFTQHGFRFAEVSGLGAPISDDQIAALEMHADLKMHSALAFGGAGAETLNGIVHMVAWGQKR